MRDQYRRGLKDNLKYDYPPMNTLMEWNEIIKDAKEIRLHGSSNELEKGKRRYVMIVLSRM